MECQFQAGDIIRWRNDPPERYFLVLNVRSADKRGIFTLRVLDLSTGDAHDEFVKRENDWITKVA